MARRNAPPPVSVPKNSRKLIAFGWYGGKYSHLDWLLPLLPGCHHYCEPFAGSGAVLLNRPSARVETYNDLDGEVANFFRVLRDHKDELTEKIGLTPFSREEFGLACEIDTALSPVESARAASTSAPARCGPGWHRPPASAGGRTAKTRVGRA